MKPIEESAVLLEHPAVTLLREAVTLLREIEWRGTCQNTGADQCPSCFSTKAEGHDDDCKLATLAGANSAASALTSPPESLRSSA